MLQDTYTISHGQSGHLYVNALFAQKRLSWRIILTSVSFSYHRKAMSCHIQFVGMSAGTENDVSCFVSRCCVPISVKNITLWVHFMFTRRMYDNNLLHIYIYLWVEEYWAAISSNYENICHLVKFINGHNVTRFVNMYNDSVSSM